DPLGASGLAGLRLLRNSKSCASNRKMLCFGSKPGFLRDAQGLFAYVLRSDICESLKLTAAVDSLSLLDERLHPAKNACPSLRVIRRGLGIVGKSFLTNPHHRARPNLLRSTMK